MVQWVGATFYKGHRVTIRHTRTAEAGEGDDSSAPKQTVSVKTIKISAANGLLENEDDIQGYVEALRDALMDVLKDGKRISL